MSNRNVLFVHYGGSSPPFLPVGVLYVANSLRNEGYSPTLIPSDTPLSTFESILSELDPLYIGFSVFTFPQILEMISLSIFAKKKGFITVWGGHHPTILAEQCIREPFVDYVIRGEGEEVAVSFTRELFEGNFRSKKIIFESPIIIEKLDDFQIALNLVDLNKYISTIPEHLVKIYGPLTSLGYILTSRGCSSRCKFCGVHAIYSRGNRPVWHAHSPEFVHEQVRYIKSKVASLDSIIIWDDNFFRVNRLEERAKKILEMLVSEGLQYTIETRSNFLCNQDNVRYLRDTGCLQVFIGAESGSQFVLDLMRKDTKVKNYLRAVENCLHEGLPIRLSFFYGYPGETIEDINRTKELIKLLKSYGEGVTISGPKMYRPVPGTEGFRDAIKCGFIPPENTKGWAKVNSNTDPLILPWLLHEAIKEGIESDKIYEWLSIRI